MDLFSSESQELSQSAIDVTPGLVPDVTSGICAAATSCTICDSTVSEPTLSARITTLPLPFSVAPITFEPMVFSTGTGPKKSMAQREKLRRLADAAKNGRMLGGFWQHMLVAEGSIEVAVDLTSQPWDLASLGIIVEEAGGRSTNIAGERTIYSGDFISTNGKVHEAVLKILR